VAISDGPLTDGDVGIGVFPDGEEILIADVLKVKPPKKQIKKTSRKSSGTQR